MKMNNLTKMSKHLLALLIIAFLFTACSSDDGVAPPDEENPVEEFTNIEFIFTNIENPEDETRGIWEDEDGFGPMEPVILQHPEFKPNTTYRLTFIMENRLVTPVENVAEDILNEDDEHQMFFEFSESLFSDPEGIGNIQDRNGAINYLDFDDNGLPLGLQTEWTTAETQTEASFRAVLGHQPGVKSDTSAWDSGDIDWDITFTINVTE